MTTGISASWLCELADEEQPGVVVPPAPLVEVAGKQHEVGPSINSLGDQSAQRRAWRRPDLVYWRAVIRDKATHRAVEVQIGGVQHP
jgi:hypothetical protein